jgi:hypothetical protein
MVSVFVESRTKGEKKANTKNIHIITQRRRLRARSEVYLECAFRALRALRARTRARWRSRIGPSVRHLAERMATDPRTGLGVLTDDDVALLFLRYQREFNRHT